MSEISKSNLKQNMLEPAENHTLHSSLTGKYFVFLQKEIKKTILQ